MNSTLWLRRSLAIIVVLILGAANIVDMVRPDAEVCRAGRGGD